MIETPVRWGILGAGGIAAVFTEDLLRLPGHEVAAVGSRSGNAAAAFAGRYGVPAAHGSYAALAADERVDVVYVATPHPMHAAPAELCLEAGRAVLVEKPFTTSSADAERLVALARERGAFAMEAMWTRFNPLVRKLTGLVRDGAVGEVTAVHADFSVQSGFDPRSRMWSRELGGGALLDLGCYVLSFTWPLLGAPDTVRALSVPAPTGVDAATGILLGYASGALAVLHCGLTGASPHTATVVGTRGRIEVAAPFYRPTSMTLVRDGREPEAVTASYDGHGYTHQAEEVARCLRAGLAESPLMPLDESVAIVRTMEEITARSG